MCALQGGLCAICRKRKIVVIDHDHRTKRIRGLLCLGCNSGLGHFQDSLRVMLNAVEYLAFRISASDDVPPPTGDIIVPDFPAPKR